MIFKNVLSILLFGYFTAAVPFSNNDANENEITHSVNSDFVQNLNKCALQTNSEDILSCATERIVRSLDELSVQSSIEITPAVSLLSDGNSQQQSFRSGKELKEKIAQGSLLELIGNATSRFFAGRTLKVKLPDSEEIGRAIEEGRKRMGSKNKNGSMMMGVYGIGAAIAALVPLFLGKIALITAKALIVGKIALVLSAILLIQMFIKGGNNNNYTPHHTVETSWTAPQTSYGTPSNSYGAPAPVYGAPAPSPQYPYSRSFNNNDEEDSAPVPYLAYSSSSPSTQRK